jgi:hypothetical protein
VRRRLMGPLCVRAAPDPEGPFEVFNFNLM